MPDKSPASRRIHGKRTITFPANIQLNRVLPKGLFELEHANFRTVAATGSELVNANIAAIYTVILGSKLTEELLNNGMRSFTNAFAEILCTFLGLPGEGNVIKVSHDLPAGVEL